MHPNDFRQPNYERMPRFPSQMDRSGDRRPREFPNRSQSTQIDRFPIREPPMRKGPNLPQMNRGELSQKSKQLILMSLPTDFQEDNDDPLNEIIRLQSSISDRFLKAISGSCEATIQGVESINKCPHLSTVYRECEDIRNDLDERYRYVEKIEDGSASNPENLLLL